jgi:phage baseplate assembly protein gpV
MEALHALMAPQTEQSRKRLVHGLVTAKVRSREDDGTYRLDYLTMGSDEPSAPARVMMPMAGGKRGTYFFPEPGDEVVVAFEAGDTNLPVILGAVWNNNDHPPDQAKQSAANNVRTIVSRSGHELTFDDTPGSEKVTLRTQGGHTLTLDDQPAAPKISLTTTQGRTLVLDDTPPGQISLSTPAGVQITLSDAGGMLTLAAPLQISLQSALISMQANLITLTTTGSPTASLVTIDTVPFGLHMHTPPALPPDFVTTGPVAPA